MRVVNRSHSITLDLCLIVILRKTKSGYYSSFDMILV